MHNEISELAGKVVKIKSEANRLGGSEIRIEDWWDRVAGKSWMFCDGNPACLQYALRTGAEKGIIVPVDNEVVYGKIGCFGHLVHISEIVEEKVDKNDERNIKQIG